MREMARHRLKSKKYILAGVLLGTYIYLYGIRLNDRPLRANGSITSFDTANIRSHNKASLEATETMPILLPDANQHITEHQDAPEKEEIISLDGRVNNEDMLLEQNSFVVADEVNRAVVELINSISSSFKEKNQKEYDKSASTAKNNEIKHFPPMKTTPLEYDDNKTLQVLDLWNFDGKCAGFQVSLLKDNSLERRALVSFPGSGNSWLRMLIQGVSGVFIASIYPVGDDNLFHSKANSTYQVPIDCGCILLQKTHDFSLDSKLFHLPEINRTRTLVEFEGKGILILRNPFSSIRSYRNFDSGGMKGMAPDAAFQGRLWDDFVSRSVASWETLAHVWIRGLKQGGIIYYEKLRHEMPSELARLSKMLGLTYNQERLDCVIRHSKDNSFKRNSTRKTVKNPYTASQRLLIHKAIESVQAVLKERGLDPLPTQYYEFFSVVPEYGISSNTTRD